MSEAGPASSSGFDLLAPDLVLEAAEATLRQPLDGSVRTYASYVNRVYGLRAEDGVEYVAKFYRPGRWSLAAILEEHSFLFDCREAELPVVAPLADAEGASLQELEIETDDAPPFRMAFTLFPKRGGRGFDAERDEDWLRLGALTGRLHAVGRKKPAAHRLRFGSALCRGYLGELLPLVHPDFRGEFEEATERILERIAALLDSLPLQRIHGDLHRGNILERPDEGLLLIDFDDMLLGPPIQDLWLLLPGRVEECARELNLLLEGYGEFSEPPSHAFALVEPLRFCRMLHFLAWRARQRHDRWFHREFPDWGGRAFWLQELEDFRDQGRVISQAFDV